MLGQSFLKKLKFEFCLSLSSSIGLEEDKKEQICVPPHAFIFHTGININSIDQ
jgi:hypothetical protein